MFLVQTKERKRVVKTGESQHTETAKCDCQQPSQR